MKKIFSFLLISAGLMIGTQAKADFAADWANAVDNGGTIVLNDDVDGVAEQLVLATGKTVTIDLNGYDLDFVNQNLEIQHGALIITGEGKVSSSATSLLRVKGSTDPSAENYSMLTVGKDVIVECTGGYAVMIPNNSGKAYGVVIDIYGQVFGFYGGIYINGSVNATTGNTPSITVEKDAVIAGTDEEAAGIYAGGYGNFFIMGTVQGDNGIYSKGGKIVLDGAAIIATGSYSKPQPNGNGFEGSGNALIFDTNSSYPGKIEFEAKNNPIVSAQDGYAIEELITQGSSSDMISINVTSGSFEGSKGGITTSEDVQSKLQAGTLGAGITGGEFSNTADDMMKYLDETVSAAAEIEDGKVIIAKKDAELTERQVVAGNFGTICYEFDCANFGGALFFQIAEASADGLLLEEVAKLEAGKPYIFLATASKIVLEQGQEVATQPETVNHLVGSFEEKDIAEGTYIILNNKMTPCGTGCKVGAHRAYIDLGEVGAPVQARRVGGRTISMGADAVTAMGEVRPAKSAAVKMMQRGRLVINHKGIKYSADGKRFK